MHNPFHDPIAIRDIQNLQLVIAFRTYAICRRSNITPEEFNFFGKMSYNTIHGTFDGWQDYKKVPPYVLVAARTVVNVILLFIDGLL